MMLLLALLSLTLTVFGDTCADEKCCYAIKDGFGTQYCKQADGDDCDIFSDSYTPGECGTLGYTTACVCRYDIPFWLKPAEKDQCSTNPNCHLAVTTTGPPTKYCFHVEYSSDTFTKGYCRQASDDESDSCETFKDYYNAPGTCQDDSPYMVACRNVNDQFMIDLWVSPMECDECQKYPYKVVDDPKNQCDTNKACCVTTTAGPLEFPVDVKEEVKPISRLIQEEIVEE